MSEGSGGNNTPTVEVDKPSSNSDGCLSTIVGLLVVWALVFGVSFGGKHYDLSCSCSKGVEFTHED